MCSLTLRCNIVQESLTYAAYTNNHIALPHSRFQLIPIFNLFSIHPQSVKPFMRRTKDRLTLAITPSVLYAYTFTHC